ncbi:MAG: condensation domain-containing protein, partial [Pyrinomonadaceae bacterium]
MNLENIEDIYSLSPLQKGMLFQTLFDENPWVYFQQLSLRLRSRLDVDAFTRAWQQVVARTPALRTSFEWNDLDAPLQIVHRCVEMPCEYEDWSHLSPSEQERSAVLYAEADRRRAFDLTAPPLMRLRLFRLGADEYEFIWSYHHILLDGWSLPLVLGDAFACYEALARGREWSAPQRRSFADHVGWLQTRDEAAAKEFWSDALAGFTAPTSLPLERTRGGQNAAPDEQFAVEELALAPEATAGLNVLARQCQVTLNTIIQGAWALLLGSYSGVSDVIYGTTVSGRPPELTGVETMVGLFINTLPVRARLDAHEPLFSWLKDFQRHLVEMRQFEYISLAEIQKWSAAPAGVPLFESLLVFENYPVPDAGANSEKLIRISGMNFFEQGNYPLTLSVGPGATLALRCTYDARRFEPAAGRQLLDHLAAALSSMASDPHQRLGDINILSTAERQRILVEWGEGGRSGAPDTTIDALFAQHVASRPDSPALVCADSHLSYAALDRSANRCARLLLAHHLSPDT